MPVIQCEAVSKFYRRGMEGASLKQSAAAWLAGEPPDTWTCALRDVSLAIDAGECVGVIGANGSGKSTLLRLLAQVSKPSAGRVETRGRTAAMLALASGFHPDLSGRENVYLNGTILGLRRAEIRRQFDDIVAFSELEAYIDSPVKHYSSGMTLRLGFAVAAHVRCDILLVDEVLAVGDRQFAQKCRERMRRLRDAGTTIVIASHDLWMVSSFCSRAVLFSKGVVEADGAPEEIVRRYQEGPGPDAGDSRPVDEDVVLEVKVGDQSNHNDFSATVLYKTRRVIETGTFLLTIRRHDGLVCCTASSPVTHSISGHGQFEVCVQYLRLTPDDYTAEVSMMDEQRGLQYGRSAADWFVIGGHRTELDGVIRLNSRWSPIGGEH
jgi:ABC-type polysaccharide/polyol phosphate transport system ATPase subunit